MVQFGINILMEEKPLSTRCKISIPDEKFVRAKDEAELYYDSLDKVFCPYFKEDIFFNTKGLQHVKFKEWQKERTVVEQYYRLRLLPLVPKVLGKSNTLQGFKEDKVFARQKKHGNWEKTLVSIKYYEFISVIKDSTRIKVIVKQEGENEKYFWSIIPFWKSKSMLDGRAKKQLHSGYPETD
jgi:hypothetical protein